MSKKKKLPLVVICGRPNVGKSTLFNRITGRQTSIIHDVEGITRDRTENLATWHGKRFRMMDTGGIIDNPVDSISQKMQVQVQAALDEAYLIMFVVDGRTELTMTDEIIRQSLHKLGKPVILAVNKLDNDELEMNRFNFYEMGMGEPHAISSGHGHGVNDLMKAVCELLPEECNFEEPEEVDDLAEDGENGEDGKDAEEENAIPGIIKVAVVGKPNVGKSSFINALLNEERVIVDDTPGTTRDAVDIEFSWQDKEYLFIDTAGLRKKAGIKAPVEHFSVSRTLRAIRRADVALIMIDATEGLTEQDKRIIGYCMENYTAMIFVWTKWDLVEDKATRFKELPEEIEVKMTHLDYVPIVTVSNITRQRIFTVFEYIDRVMKQVDKRITTAEVNRFIEYITQKHHPSSVKGHVAKIYYGTQVSTKPTCFVLKVNKKSLFHFSYVRFIENQLRERFGFEGVPIQIELREDE